MIITQNRIPSRGVRLKGRIILMGLALLILVACSPNGTHTTDKNGQSDNILRPDDPNSPNLWKRIIVRLDVTNLKQMQAQAAKQKDPKTAKAMDQKIAQRIATVANMVLNRVEPAGAKLVRRYNTLPLLALQASPKAIEILESMPEVLAIEDDRLKPPARQSDS